MSDLDLHRVTRERDEAVRERDNYRAAWHAKSAHAETLAEQLRDALVQREHWEREAIAAGNRCALAEAELATRNALSGPQASAEPPAPLSPPQPRQPV